MIFLFNYIEELQVTFKKNNINKIYFKEVYQEIFEYDC